MEDQPADQPTEPVPPPQAPPPLVPPPQTEPTQTPPDQAQPTEMRPTQSEPPQTPPPQTPPSTPPPSAFRRLWWLWLILGFIAVFLIAFFIGRATDQEPNPGKILLIPSTSSSTTTAASTTTSEASTTTTAASSTTTSAPTTTTSATTTTTATSTTTTAASVTSTTGATTSTTGATTSTTRPPTSTTGPGIPAGTVVVGPDSNGKTETIPANAAGLMLVLPDDTADSFTWQLAAYDTKVLKLQGNPIFVPNASGSTKGARIWSFAIAGPGTTDLKLSYADKAGTVEQQFSVVISVE